MTNIEDFLKELTDNNIIITGKSTILYDEIKKKYIDKEKEFISILEIRNKIYDSLPTGNNLTAFDVIKKMSSVIDYLDNISNENKT